MYIGISVSTCNWDKGDCLLCCLSIGKPSGDCCNSDIAICDIIANIVVVDEIAIGYFEYTFNVCNCCCYSNYYDEKVVPINNHFPFVVTFDT